jgi:hypothetical protein
VGNESCGLECRHAAEGLLDQLPCAWNVCGFRAADLVGLGRDDPDCVLELVGRLSQRLVLSLSS